MKLIQKNNYFVYSGLIQNLEPNQIFVFGANPEGRHGAGAARVALERFGAEYGRVGLVGKSYGLITKNLTPNFIDSNGKIYKKSGNCSISPEELSQNIEELYNVANKRRYLDFLIAYTKDGANLNGYSAKQMAEMFYRPNVPTNIVFEEGFFDLVFQKGFDFFGF